MSNEVSDSSSPNLGPPPASKINPSQNEMVQESIASHFDKTYSSFKKLEENFEGNNPQSQKQVDQLISELEEISRTIQQLQFFSVNESVEEVEPARLKFLLVPYLLGTILYQMKIFSDRGECCQLSTTHFQNFMEQVMEYGIVNHAPAIWIRSKAKGKAEEESTTAVEQSKPQSHLTPEQKRAQKIQKHKMAKEMEARINALNKRVESGEQLDDEVYTSLYLELIKKAFMDAESQLENIMREEEMISFKAKMDASGDAGSRGSGPPSTSSLPSLGPGVPYKTFILTRTEAEKTVFGLGYPAHPVMTVEELYEQRIKDGTWSKPGSNGANPQPPKVSEEEMEELLEETDNMNLLARRRDMDEYKDDHRRGWGNRMNRS